MKITVGSGDCSAKWLGLRNSPGLDAKLLHARNQGRALDSHADSGAIRTGNTPFSLLRIRRILSRSLVSLGSGADSVLVLLVSSPTGTCSAGP